jgi:hypothetical protein
MTEERRGEEQREKIGTVPASLAARVYGETGGERLGKWPF